MALTLTLEEAAASSSPSLLNELEDQNPFSLVSQNLRRLGGHPLERLADCPGIEFEAFDLPFFAHHIDVPTTLSTQEADAAPPIGTQENTSYTSSSSSMYNIVQLHQTCNQTFGNAEALKFEFLEEFGPDREFLKCQYEGARATGRLFIAFV
jgi:hypothetical protein